MEIVPSTRSWIKHNPLSAFLVLSIAAHFAIIFIFAFRGEDSDLSEALIRVELRDFAEKERREILPPAPEPPEELNVPEAPPPPPPDPPPPAVPAPPPPAEVILPAPAEAGREPSPPARRRLPGYIASLQAIIDREIEYPAEASRQRIEGQVTVVFALARSGQLLDLAIAPGGDSPFEPFNREALRAVRRAAPRFFAFPESVGDEVLTFRLPIIFTLH